MPGTWHLGYHFALNMHVRDQTGPPTSLLLFESFCASPQQVRGLEPVLFSAIPADSPVLPIVHAPVPRFRRVQRPDAVFVYSSPRELCGMPISPLRVFKSLPGVLPSGLMILFRMGFRCAAVRMGGNVVQLGGPLVILVMRSVVITIRHL